MSSGRYWAIDRSRRGVEGKRRRIVHIKRDGETGELYEEGDRRPLSRYEWHGRVMTPDESAEVQQAHEMLNRFRVWRATQTDRDKVLCEAEVVIEQAERLLRAKGR